MIRDASPVRGDGVWSEVQETISKETSNELSSDGDSILAMDLAQNHFR